MKSKKIRVILYIVAIIIFQSILYSFSKYISREPVVIGSMLDDYIYFSNIAIIPYILWYFLLFILPIFFYKKRKQLYVKYIVSLFIITILANIIFVIYPTTVIRPTLVNLGLLNRLTNLIYLVDTPAMNCFPSLHCATCMLWILYALEDKKIRIPYKISIIIVSILIMMSTLIIKQHVLVDATGGCAIAIIAYLIVGNNIKAIFNIRKRIKLE